LSEQVLFVNQVRKTIKNREIIKGISLEINKGEVVGFLGPNGAGKSTTLRMVVGLSKPTSGSIIIYGYDVQKDYVKAMEQVGCIIEGPDMYNYMSGFSNLEMLNTMGTPVSNKEIMKVVKLVGLENRIHDKVRIYSMGMKQRLALAAALLHKPKLLILDEPTNGLDPQGIYEFRKIIKNLSEVEGISVLISSHLISEVQLMCQKVAIINQGEIIASASVDNLITSNDIIWKTDDNLKAIGILKPYVKNLKIVDDGISGSAEEEQLPKLNRLLFHENIIVKQVYVKEKTLEELFLELTKNQEII
jgi:ABC-2 type transport system ATP-binding protein